MPPSVRVLEVRLPRYFNFTRRLHTIHELKDEPCVPIGFQGEAGHRCVAVVPMAPNPQLAPVGRE
jgi:hypothetical protein